MKCFIQSDPLVFRISVYFVLIDFNIFLPILNYVLSNNYN